LLGNFIGDLEQGLLDAYHHQDAHRLGSEEEFQASVNKLAVNVENFVRKRLGDLWSGDIRLELTFGSDEGAATLGEAIIKRKLRNTISEVGQMVSREPELGPALEGITMPGYDGAVWTAYWEYPGYVQFSHPDLDITVSATPNFERNNTIAMAIDTHDGKNLDAWDLGVRWTGDVEKDKQLWTSVLEDAWRDVENIVDEWLNTL
jgi:hypothetical protein